MSRWTKWLGHATDLEKATREAVDFCDKSHAEVKMPPEEAFNVTNHLMIKAKAFCRDARGVKSCRLECVNPACSCSSEYSGCEEPVVKPSASDGDGD